MPTGSSPRDTRAHFGPDHLARAAFALVALASGLVAGFGQTGADAASASNWVTITRDPNGIPHITARNFGPLGYGEA